MAIRRVLPAIAQIRLEIPSAPVAAWPLSQSSREPPRTSTAYNTRQGYYLLGVKFSRPLLIDPEGPRESESTFHCVKMFAHDHGSWLRLRLYAGYRRSTPRLFGKLLLFNQIV